MNDPLTHVLSQLDHVQTCIAKGDIDEARNTFEHNAILLQAILTSDTPEPRARVAEKLQFISATCSVAADQINTGDDAADKYARRPYLALEKNVHAALEAPAEILGLVPSVEKLFADIGIKLGND